MSYSRLSSINSPVNKIIRRDFHSTTPARFIGRIVIGGLIFAGAAVCVVFVRDTLKFMKFAGKGIENNKPEEDLSIIPIAFYEGGFETKMTENEAALILGVHAASPKSEVIDAHRHLTLLNNPNSGGSPFICSKVNEAKEKLIGQNSV